jgi:hypothetical protein
MRYLRTNIHTGTQTFLDHDGVIESLKRDGSKLAEKLAKRVSKGLLLDYAHYWYRVAREGDCDVI